MPDETIEVTVPTVLSESIQRYVQMTVALRPEIVGQNNVYMLPDVSLCEMEAPVPIKSLFGTTHHVFTVPQRFTSSLHSVFDGLLAQFELLSDSATNFVPSLAAPRVEAPLPTTIHQAVATNDGATLRRLLQRGDNPSARVAGRLPLHIAAGLGSVELVHALLSGQGAALVDAAGPEGTALHCAAGAGSASCASELIYHGADPNAALSTGLTPLHIACSKGDLRMARILLRAGADPTQPTRNGATPLHKAAVGGSHDIVTTLIERGATGSATDHTGATPVAVARENHHAGLAVHLDRSRSRERVVRIMDRIPQPLLLLFLLFLLSIWAITFIFTAAPSGALLLCLIMAFPTLSVGLMLVSSLSDPGHTPSTPMTAQLDDGLCLTCHAYKASRTKHCAVCDVCVDSFDHHCLWIDNCVGAGNRRVFCAMLVVTIIAQIQTVFIPIVQLLFPSLFGVPAAYHSLLWTAWYHLTRRGPMLIMALVALPTMYQTVGLAILQARNITKNRTTNEMINWSRYNHLVDPDTGRAVNPFHKGVVGNWVDFILNRPPVDYEGDP